MSKFIVGFTVGVVVGVAAFGASLWVRHYKTAQAIDDLVTGFEVIRKDHKATNNNLTLRDVLIRYELLLAEIKARVRVSAIDPEEIEKHLDNIAESHRSILDTMSKY